MSESVKERRRRKFVAGVLDQAASIAGAVAGATVAAGVVAPIVATAVGTLQLSPTALLMVGGVSMALGATFTAVALLLKGRAKQADDDTLAATRFVGLLTADKVLSRSPEAQ